MAAGRFVYRACAKNWILRYRVSGGITPVTQYCPICLDISRPLYLRRNWRLAWFTICPDHQVWLQDSCPHCCQPLPATTRGIAVLLAGMCPYCGYELSLSDAVTALDNKNLALLQVTVEKALLSGEWNPMPGIYSSAESLLGIMEQLFIQLVTLGHYRKTNFFSFVPEELRDSNDSHPLSLAGSSLKLRKAVFGVIANAIDKWPYNLMRISRCNNFYLPWNPDLRNDLSGSADATARQRGVAYTTCLLSDLELPYSITPPKRRKPPLSKKPKRQHQRRVRMSNEERIRFLEEITRPFRAPEP